MIGFASSRIAATVAVASLVSAAMCVQAADLTLPASGNILGAVMDTRGIPQIGANIQLFNKFERLIAKTSTGVDGQFGFAGLPADVYSVQVWAASYLPVSRRSIAVKPGLDSVLRIHLATLVSSVELTYAVPTGGMSNDWKWVLRSSPATRPITRLVDVEKHELASKNPKLFPNVFSGTHAMLSLSGGDSSLIDANSTQSDIGTGFVLSTNVFGKNQVQVGGNVAQMPGFGPAAMSICAIYTRTQDSSSGPTPEVTLTVSQFGLNSGPNTSAPESFESGPPAVRAMSLSIYQTMDPTDRVHLEYGATGESVDFLQHTSRVSPFARMTVSGGAGIQAVASYADGGRPDELSAHQPQTGITKDEIQGNELAMAAGTLTRLPQLSYANGRLELQRTQSYEVGIRRTSGSRTYAVSAFREQVSNGRINVAGDTEALNAGDLLSDGTSKTLIYGLGRYRRNGAVVSVDQRLGDSLDVSMAYGRMGGFTADSNPDSQGGSLQSRFLEEKMHHIASANLAARIPRTGTRIRGNYGWMNDGAIIPRHVFTTQNTYISPGLNLMIRQPLPAMFGMPGHFEVTVELRNLLAQGYLPVNTGDGHTLLVVQAPRAVRGGLNFIF